MKQFVIVSGVSGAGKSSVLKILEDTGFEVIDNLPLSLLSQVISDTKDDSSVAVGIDARTRDFDCDELCRLCAEIKKDKESFSWIATMNVCCVALPKQDVRIRWPETKNSVTE